MPRARIYANATERQRARRRRLAAKRDGNVTNRGDLGDFMEKLAFIRDTALETSQRSIANWRGWRGSAEIHCHALQTDLDAVIERLDALLRGDACPFESPDWMAWKKRV